MISEETSASFPDYLDQLSMALRTPFVEEAAERLLYVAPDLVRGSYDRDALRRSGAFFTDRTIAGRLADRLNAALSTGAGVLDPSLGAGDLLLACASHLPRADAPERTIALWSKLLMGFEMNPDFVFAAKLRLLLFVRIIHGGAKLSRRIAHHAFPLIREQDFFVSDLSSLEAPICFVTNPPYTVTRHERLKSSVPPKGSTAALFLEKLCCESPAYTQIVGLFPEVLRCGSSYHSFRTQIAQHVNLIHEESIGRFHRHVDVDVFVAHYEKRKDQAQAIMTCMERRSQVSDHFHVSVGPVVPHRDPRRGHWHKYISAKTVPSWTKSFLPDCNRRWQGPLKQPPFVVVRRTSRPGQPFRAVASVVTGAKPVAIENHLIVLQPKDGTVSTCRRLVDALRSEFVNNELNTRMRCRHLTVASLKSLRLRL